MLTPPDLGLAAVIGVATSQGYIRCFYSISYSHVILLDEDVHVSRLVTTITVISGLLTSGEIKNLLKFHKMLRF